MSAIPPHVIGSAVQAGMVQAEQSRQSDAEKNERASQTRTIQGNPDAILEVEATDADTQVHTDAGGLGSQGRHDEPAEEAPEEVAQDSAENGVTTDEQGRRHIDLEA